MTSSKVSGIDIGVPSIGPHHRSGHISPHSSKPILADATSPEKTPRGTPVRPLSARLADALHPGVRAPGWGKRYNDLGDYPRQFWRSAIDVGEHLDLTKSGSLRATLDQLGRRRQSIADAAHDPLAHQFGRWRSLAFSDGMHTPIAGPYAQDSSVRAFMPIFQANDTSRFGQHVVVESFDFPETRPEDRVTIWTIRGQLPQVSGDCTWVNLTVWDGSRSMYWHHGSLTPGILAHMENLFRAALGHDSKDIDGVVRCVARLQWWMAHTCPFSRGSAAVADMLAAGILWSHDLKRPQAKPMTSIDLAAICSPIEMEFVESYARLFEGPPQPLGALTQRQHDDRRSARAVPVNARQRPT